MSQGTKRNNLPVKQIGEISHLLWHPGMMNATILHNKTPLQTSNICLFVSCFVSFQQTGILPNHVTRDLDISFSSERLSLLNRLLRQATKKTYQLKGIYMYMLITVYTILPEFQPYKAGIYQTNKIPLLGRAPHISVFIGTPLIFLCNSQNW